MMHFASTPPDATTHNMLDITSDFDLLLKVSALEKVSRVQETVREVTIGPDSTLISDRNTRSENIENEPENYIDKDVKSPIKSPSLKVSTRSGITFSKKKILLENEQQRKEQVGQTLQCRFRCMEEIDNAIQNEMTLYKRTVKMQRPHKEKLKEEELARLVAEEEHLAQQTEIERKHEQQLEREEEEQRKRNRERRLLIERMLPLQASFSSTYQDIVAISKSCKDRSVAGAAFAPHSAKLKERYKCMEGLIEHAKMGDLTEADISMAEVLVKHNEDIRNAFRLEIERINAAYDADIAHREENLRRVQVALRAEEAAKFQSPPAVPHAIQHEQKPSEHQQAEGHNLEQSTVAQVPEARSQPNPTESVVPEAVAKTELTRDGLLGFMDKDSFQLYVNSQQLLENHRMLYSSLTNSDTTKKFRFECRKAINIPVNAISGASSEHLTDKFERLHRLLAGRPPINANHHPQGIAFCKHELAEKFVSQGATFVSSKPEMAFSIAAVVIGIWSEYPDVGELVLAYFHKMCPYLVPIFPPQHPGQSNEEYYKSLGYIYSEDGKVEGQDQFLKRMSGMMRLYAALTVTKQRNNVTTPHPHDIKNAWRWLAAILNIEPRPDICATLILDMLEVAGHALWKTYKAQFQKLLTLIASQYYPKMQSIGTARGGPMSRLEGFLKKCLTTGSISPPNGQLPPNFW